MKSIPVQFPWTIHYADGEYDRAYGFANGLTCGSVMAETAQGAVANAPLGMRTPPGYIAVPAFSYYEHPDRALVKLIEREAENARAAGHLRLQNVIPGDRLRNGTGYIILSVLPEQKVALRQDAIRRYHIVATSVDHTGQEIAKVALTTDQVAALIWRKTLPPQHEEPESLPEPPLLGQVLDTLPSRIAMAFEPQL